MSDEIIKTLIVMVGILVTALPLVWILWANISGYAGLKKTKRAIEARKLEREYSANQIDGRK